MLPTSHQHASFGTRSRQGGSPKPSQPATLWCAMQHQTTEGPESWRQSGQGCSDCPAGVRIAWPFLVATTIPPPPQPVLRRVMAHCHLSLGSSHCSGFRIPSHVPPMPEQMAQRGNSHPNSPPPTCLQFFTSLAASHEGLDPRDLGQTLQTPASQFSLRVGFSGLACMDRVPGCFGPGGTHAGKAE